MKNEMRRVLFVVFNIYLFSASYAINDSLLQIRENEIMQEIQKLDKFSSQEENSKINKRINESMQSLLKYKESFTYSFTSLKSRISIMESPDNQFRIFTWNSVSNKGEYENFGYIQTFNKKNDSYHYYQLFDKSDSLENPMNLKLYSKNWFGAVYYKLIPFESKGKDFYLLFGWDGNNLLSTKKVIDVISFENGLLSFGAPVFNFENELKSRIVFEYSVKTNMALDYNEKKKMIIFDHLSPSKPIYTGKFEFYGPDFSYDAFVFENEIWNYVTDIDIRNQKPQKK